MVEVLKGLAEINNGLLMIFKKQAGLTLTESMVATGMVAILVPPDTSFSPD